MAARFGRHEGKPINEAQYKFSGTRAAEANHRQGERIDMIVSGEYADAAYIKQPNGSYRKEMRIKLDVIESVPPELAEAIGEVIESSLADQAAADDGEGEESTSEE